MEGVSRHGRATPVCRPPARGREDGAAVRRVRDFTGVAAIRAEFEQRVAAEEFIDVAQKSGDAGRALTIRDMLDGELDTIRMMRAGQQTQPAMRDALTTDLAYDYCRRHGSRPTGVSASRRYL